MFRPIPREFIQRARLRSAVARPLPLRAALVAMLVLLGAWPTPRAESDDRADSQLFPPELVDFVPYKENPVFTAGGAGQWDARIRERGWILREGDLYRMWYTGYDGTREGLKMLGYATSPDGLRWKRHPDNPIYRAHWVEDMMVLRHEGTFYMFAEGRDDQAHLLTSREGVAWTRQGQLDIRKTDGTLIDPGPYGTPTAWHEGGSWYLFYERRDAGVWLAKSEDLKVFTNIQDDPVLRPGPEEYDRDLIALNQIIRYGGRYYAYYHGAAVGREQTLWATAIATSDDLINWTKYGGNPLFPIEDNRSSGILVEGDRGFRLYTMHNRVDAFLPLKAEVPPDGRGAEDPDHAPMDP